MDCAALVARYGSPLYIYDAERVRDAWQAFTAAFPYQPMACHYAIVCNKNRRLVQILHQLGAGIHANTPGDVHAALAAGVPASRIVYSGTNLDASDIEYLSKYDIALNLDSLDQLTALPPGQGGIGCRFLIDDRANRIGITAEELPAARRLAEKSGRRLTGLHMYAGTNTRRASRFLECLDRLLAAAGTLPDLQYVDLGGGYGVPYDDGDRPLDLAALGQAVTDRMEALSSSLGRRIQLWLEPGRMLVAAAGVLAMTVVSVKTRGSRRFVGVDSTVGNIVVPSVYHTHHRVEALTPRGEVLPVATDVCGNTTHSRDFLARDCSLPELQVGDLLLLRDVGAYGYATSSHFLNRPRPAEVVVDGGQTVLTTRRETLEDLLATQVPLSPSPGVRAARPPLNAASSGGRAARTPGDGLP